jgi:hypothetical protein
MGIGGNFLMNPGDLVKKNKFGVLGISTGIDRANETANETCFGCD